MILVHVFARSTIVSHVYHNIKKLIYTSIPGNGVTSDPVAIKIFFVAIFSSVPSLLTTVTSLGPLILPNPCTCVTYKKLTIRNL